MKVNNVQCDVTNKHTNNNNNNISPLKAQQISGQSTPSQTTSFLNPCNEEVLEERIPVFRRSERKKDVMRSLSCDIVPKKPHPFRSPIMSLITHSLPRTYKKRLQDDHLETKFRGLSLSSADSWNTEEDFSYFLQQTPNSARAANETTENTPFTKLAYQPYYPRRQTFHGKTHKKSSKSLNEDQSSREDKLSPCVEDDVDGSLRRRASSLDFLPEAVGAPKSLNHNGHTNNNKNSSPFARTTSMSQRSPFRKKIAYADSVDNSITGIRELRPKGAKRSKNSLDALFDAIERQEVIEVRKLINIHDIDINDTNSDQFTPLDFALMLNEVESGKLLLSYGAKENPSFLDPEERCKHLTALIEATEELVNNLKATCINSDTKESERQLREKEWRLYLLRIMQSEVTNTEPPSQPPSIVIASLSSESILVTLNPSVESADSKEMVTKYKVEWSRHEDFSVIENDVLLTDRRQMTFTISGLEKNINWYVRVMAGNHKGFSSYGYPDPRAVIPSSWHECDNSVPRYYGVGDEMCRLVDDLMSLSKKNGDKSSDDGSDDENTNNNGTSPISRSPKAKNGGRKLVKSMSKYTNFIFNSAPKLLKKIKGHGIYLAALLYNDDCTKVLVTMDENLPIVECDDNYSKSFNQEFYWFAKASRTWEDIQHMLYLSTKSHSSQSVHMRRKLLQSALVLMNATGVNDLGPIHFKQFRDDHGSILLLAVNSIKKISSSRSMTMKWMPISKLLKRSNVVNDNAMVPERLIPSVQEQVMSHQNSKIKLPKGLYLGYLKLRTSMDTLSILVPNSHTNVLPHVKIHDIPNVTKEQWDWLKSLNNTDRDADIEVTTTSSVQTFERCLKAAVNKLFTRLNISETALSHRIYDQEVIEFNSEVLFLLISPSEICTPPNQSDGFSNLPGYSALPVQAFEMANMMTYQPKLMSSYCRLSSILELETFSTQQNVRETICNNETKTLKEKQARIATLQQSVDELWRVSRWLMDTLQTCQQEKNSNVCIPLTNLFQIEDWTDMACCRLSINSQYSDTSERGNDSPTSSTASEEFQTNKRISSFSLKVHGTEEVGLCGTTFVEVTIDEKTTVNDVIQSAVTKFLNADTQQQQHDMDGETAEQTMPPSPSSSSILSTDNLEDIALVIVAGSRERCLREDLNLMQLQNPWEKGTLYLRLKKDALRATKWGLSTTV